MVYYLFRLFQWVPENLILPYKTDSNPGIYLSSAFQETKKGRNGPIDGNIDVGDRCWRQIVLMTSLRCLRPILYIKLPTSFQRRHPVSPSCIFSFILLENLQVFSISWYLQFVASSNNWHKLELAGSLANVLKFIWYRWWSQVTRLKVQRF